MGRVADKVAIVTGAASGIGEQIARLLAREGAKVVVSDLQEDRASQVAAQIVDAGGAAIHIKQDVISETGWRTVIDATLGQFGALHILVNNAGIGEPRGDVEQLSLDQWRRMIQVNLDGVFLGTKYAIEAMRRNGVSGSIVNISSILGIAGSGTTAAYTASKGGVRLFTKSAALHCAKSGYGIRVNSVHPGFIETPMLQAALSGNGEIDDNRKRVEQLTPLGHTGAPLDIAYGVLYLASDESAFVTGTELVIDGGYLAQ